jgi:dTDP-L-rhamnose 4-epimerase
VNIHDVVDANVLVLTDERAAGRIFNVGGGTGYTALEFADIVRRHYDSELAPRITGEYRFGDTRHIQSDIDALKQLGWFPERTPADSVAEYAAWLQGTPGLDRILSEADAKMRALGVVRKAAG